MKDASTYQPAQQFGLLLVGEPGAGKTCLALEFPDAYILDCDRNLSSGLALYAKRRGRPKADFWYDAPDVDAATGAKLDPAQVWDNGRRLLGLAGADSRVRTVIVDGLTRWMTYLQHFVISQGSQMEKPLTVGGQKMMTISLYAPFESLMTQFIVDLRALGKPVIVTAHLRSGESDLNDAAIWQPYIVGQLRNSIAGLFSDYWLCETETVTLVSDDLKKRYPTGTRYFVRTAPNARAKFKNSLGLPPTFEFTWEGFSRFLQPAAANAAATPPATPTTPAQP